MAEKTAVLEKITDEKEGLLVVYSLKELRARRLIESIKINTIYENTAETYAESLRNQYYVSELLTDEGGKKIYSSLDDLQNKQTDQLVQEALLNIMIFIARISDDYQMQFAENKWLLKAGVINEKGDLIKKDIVTEPDPGITNKVEVSPKVENTKV